MVSEASWALFIVILVFLGLTVISSEPAGQYPAFNRLMKEARDCLRTKDYAGAAQKLEAALALTPYSAIARDALGVAYSQLGQYERAIQNFDVALRIDPKLSMTHNNLGYVYLQLNRLKEGESEFRQAIQIDTNNDTAYTNLGRLLVAKGLSREATQAFQAALRRNPGNTEAQQALAKLTGMMASTATDFLPRTPETPIGFKIIISDPSKILYEGGSMAYYPLGPTSSLLIEIAPGPSRTLSFEVWLQPPSVKGHLYWSYVPQPNVPRQAPIATISRMAKPVSGISLATAGFMELSISPETRECFLSASQPAYITKVALATTRTHASVE